VPVNSFSVNLMFEATPSSRRIFEATSRENRRENAEMIGTFDRVQLRADRLCERGGWRRFQSRLPADLLNPAGLELEMVPPSLTKSRCHCGPNRNFSISSGAQMARKWEWLPGIAPQLLQLPR
jgi:hypothetical protein